MKIGINDNILSLTDRTPDSLMLGIAERVKQRRLEKGWTQKMLAFVLDMTDEFEALFNSKTYQSIDDIVKTDPAQQRKRGHKNE